MASDVDLDSSSTCRGSPTDSFSGDARGQLRSAHGDSLHLAFSSLFMHAMYSLDSTLNREHVVQA
jgi:hypothetical protein